MIQTRGLKKATWEKNQWCWKSKMRMWDRKIMRQESDEKRRWGSQLFLWAKSATSIMTMVYACQHFGFYCQLCLRFGIFEEQYDCFQRKILSSNGVFSSICAGLQTHFFRLQQPAKTCLEKSDNKFEINEKPKTKNTHLLVICLSNLFGDFLGFNMVAEL